MRRGDIHLAELPPPLGSRPVLLVTRTAAITVRTAVTVAPVTRTIRDIPSEVPLGRGHGLKQRSVANCDSLQTIPMDALSRRPLGRLKPDELPVLDRALRFSLGTRT
ncbi:MAG: type II toxin-antitoxin system PemK/MazF family toxin [Actinomycetota bacterium]